MSRAFIYIRVSTADQEYSPEVQTSQCSLYCGAKSLEIAQVFDESSVSGKVPMADRPKGAEMLARLGEVDAVVFAKLDRAFRDTVDCILTVDLLRSAGKTVHFLDLGVDTSTAAGQLCLEMMASFAKFERRRIVDRTREAMAVAKSRGQKIGPAPFGFQNNARGQHITNLREFQTLKAIQELAGTGVSLAEIARQVNAAGMATREGKAWTHRQIGRILRRKEA